MKIDGLFIEYLISGGVAILWIYPILIMLGLDVSLLNLDPSAILIGIPITYVIGMMIDYIAAELLRGYKTKIRIRVYKDLHLKEHTFYDALFEISKFNQTIVKHLEMRESRVRAARGIFLNLIFALPIIPIYFVYVDNAIMLFVSILFLLLALILSWFIFKKMIKLTYYFQAMMVGKLLDEKR